MLLPLLFLACLGYVILAITTVVRSGPTVDGDDTAKTPPLAGLLLAGVVPIGVILLMVYLFIIVGASTVVQGNVGSSSRLEAWSAWVHLWPLLPFVTGLSALLNFVWMTDCVTHQDSRASIPASVYAFFLSTLAFVTVWDFAPTA